MQLAVPELRLGTGQRNFSKELAACDYSLEEWRCAFEPKALAAFT